MIQYVSFNFIVCSATYESTSTEWTSSSTKWTEATKALEADTISIEDISNNNSNQIFYLMAFVSMCIIILLTFIIVNSIRFYYFQRGSYDSSENEGTSACINFIRSR